MRTFWALCLILLCSLSTFSQKPKKYTSAEIFHEIQKLNFLGTALYVAAHPDDENTRLIAYLSNHVKAQTTYLSLTRGDGGQNLIGPELRELLGVLRTQELLAARRVDGGFQRFSRANDFGYSKHPDETLEIWDKDQVLADVVRTIRILQPDVIINRFDHRSPGRTHGHHTASAMLGLEAFDLANDPKSYPDQLTDLSLWQPKRIFFNTSWWFYGSREKFEKADKSNMVSVDIGTYYPILGVSNNEIASLASSQHLCQGFGRLTNRGSTQEYLELLKGELPKNGNDLFDGINTSWTRVKGGDAIQAILSRVESGFNFADPSTHIPELMKAMALIENLENDKWRAVKSDQIKKIIEACAGVYIESSASVANASPGESIKIETEVLNRSKHSVSLESILIKGTNSIETSNTNLTNNKKENVEMEFTIPNNASFSSPYWLTKESTLGMYEVADKNLIGLPETPAAFTMEYKLMVNGQALTIEKPLVRRYSKPDKGEIYEPFVVLPKVSASFNEDVVLFDSDAPKEITVSLKAGSDNVQGTVQLDLPNGWSAEPNQAKVNIEKKGADQNVVFKVTPPTQESEGRLGIKVNVDGKTYQDELIEIAYDHIPKQSILLPAKLKVVKTEIKKFGNSIGYIVGAGDKVPESLSQIGYNVDIIPIAEINAQKLANYHGVVIGIRAYNVHEELKHKQKLLFDYVKNGGTMVVQYNTANRWRPQYEDIAPYPLTLSRDRVTDENAKVKILASTHEVVNSPNKLSMRDFDGWVQERGLYFPNEWSNEFTPILSMADPGENAKKGSLLVAKYGNGHYVYTGLSFFRELPAGVPGAYKLFANILSLGNNNQKPKDGSGK